MESIAVEAIRQLPAFLLAILTFYFYRVARKAESASPKPAAIPAELESRMKASSNAVERIESDFSAVQQRIRELEALKSQVEETEEAIKSQLANQKMALKEFGRVLSKTSEQTYTEFGSFQERLGRIEDRLKERGLVDEETRSAAA